MGLLKRGARLFGVVTCLLVGLTSPAMAQVETQTTVFLPVSPLLITSYRTSGAGTDVEFVEVYNSGSVPVSVTDWRLVDVTNSRTMGVESRPGLLEPGRHAVIAAEGMVKDATYRFEGWLAAVTSPKLIVTLRLERSGYRPADVTLAAKPADMWMIRTYNTSSYSASASSFEANYRLLYDDGLYTAPDEPEGLEVSEIYAYASACGPFDGDVRCSDFIELHNISDHMIDLTDLVLRTDSNSSARASSNTFTLDGELAPDEYRLVSRTDAGGAISLTNSGGYIWLEDKWAIAQPFTKMLTSWPSFASSQQGLGYARDESGAWQWTAAPTPGLANIITVQAATLAACPEGKYRNPETGRCRTIEEAVSELAACDEGYERNPATNRCRKIVVSSGTTLTPCKEGYERNPATNRCRSIASAVAELIPCDEGYERNPATNRCRKVQSSSVPGAPFAVEPTAAEGQVWQWWIGGAIAAGLAGYAVWEWRHELAKLASRFRKK